MKIEDIITLGRKFAEARNKLAAVVIRIHKGKERAFEENRSEFRKAINQTNDRLEELSAAITGAPELFEKPRTLVVDGVRFGMTTAKGGIDFVDPDAVVKAIKTNLPRLADTLIHSKETPNKEGLLKLSDDQLESIGCVRLPDNPNAIVVKTTDSTVDKLVKALMKDAEPEARELVA